MMGSACCEWVKKGLCQGEPAFMLPLCAVECGNPTACGAAANMGTAPAAPTPTGGKGGYGYGKGPPPQQQQQRQMTYAKPQQKPQQKPKPVSHLCSLIMSCSVRERFWFCEAGMYR